MPPILSSFTVAATTTANPTTIRVERVLGGQPGETKEFVRITILNADDGRHPPVVNFESESWRLFVQYANGLIT